MNIKAILYKYTHALRRVKTLFYKYWNRFFFSIAGVDYKDNMRVFNRFYLSVTPSSKVKIGRNFTFVSGDSINRISRNIMGGICAGPNATITIGDNVGISASSIRAKESITIKDYVKIGADCILLDTDSHNVDYMIRRGANDHVSSKSAPIVIEEDVLIGTRCVILKGVTIGARSIIGAGSVVTKSIPPDSIAAGNPCKVIRTLSH